MVKLRVGTRGSELALWQTKWVCQRLREAHPALEIETVIIKTHGDAMTDSSFGGAWPVGAFVGALEHALLERRVDFAVHSYKDLQTAETAGLTVAAVPPREVVGDVLLTHEPARLDELPRNTRIGTNSPRRAAQMRRLRDCEIVPIRGNVPTRIARLKEGDLDAIILAAAGLKRLAIEHPFRIELPMDRFLPAPAQGSLAIQSRSDDDAVEVLSVLDHRPTRLAVDAERAVLSATGAGCHAPVGTLAECENGLVQLRAVIFSDDFQRKAMGEASGSDPRQVGTSLGQRLQSELGHLS